MWFKTNLRHAVLAAALIQVAQGLVPSGTRIVGGEPDGKFICGGSLVHNNAVVTAADCVKSGEAADFTIHAGTIYLSKTGISRKVKYIQRHIAFNANTLNYDVAVLITESPLDSNATSTIALQGSTVPDNTNCLILGHGLTKVDGAVADILQEAWVPTIGKRQCQHNYGRVATLTATMFCASVPGEKDSCSGDSGGPMVCNQRLCGIVSWGVGCAEKNIQAFIPL